MILLYTEEDWDPELRTVPPERVAEKARAVAEMYPHKRLLVHFMQPHFPPIGRMRKQIDIKGNVPDGLEHPDTDDISIRAKLRNNVGGVTVEMARQAYRENLEIVLDTVEGLLPDLSGKTVISADHGELFGERLWPIPVKGYEHAPNLGVPTLLEIPWFEVECEKRREIWAEERGARDEIERDLVEERLESLGYK
jgi:hypothetical protein